MKFKARLFPSARRESMAVRAAANKHNTSQSDQSHHNNRHNRSQSRREAANNKLNDSFSSDH